MLTALYKIKSTFSQKKDKMSRGAISRKRTQDLKDNTNTYTDTQTGTQTHQYNTHKLISLHHPIYPHRTVHPHACTTCWIFFSKCKHKYCSYHYITLVIITAAVSRWHFALLYKNDDFVHLCRRKTIVMMMMRHFSVFWPDGSHTLYRCNWCSI